MTDWRDEKGYYPTTKPCQVCKAYGVVNEDCNGIEPRFMYVVCEKHYALSPAKVSRLTQVLSSVFGVHAVRKSVVQGSAGFQCAAQPNAG